MSVVIKNITALTTAVQQISTSLSQVSGLKGDTGAQGPAGVDNLGFIGNVKFSASPLGVVIDKKKGNISDIVRIGTGTFDLTFITPLDDIHYSIFSNSSHGVSGISDSGLFTRLYTSNFTVAGFRFTVADTYELIDPDICSLLIIN